MRRFVTVLSAIVFGPVAIAGSGAQGVRAEPRPAPSSPPGSAEGKSVSVDVHSAELPVEPVAVKPLAPGEPDGTSSSRLSPANQSQAGMGFQIRFGQGAKEIDHESTPPSAARDRHFK